MDRPVRRCGLHRERARRRAVVRLRSRRRATDPAAPLGPSSVRLTGALVRVIRCGSGAGSPFLLALCVDPGGPSWPVRGRRLSVYGCPHGRQSKERPTLEAHSRTDRPRCAARVDGRADRRGGRGRRCVACLAATVDGQGPDPRRHPRTEARRGGRRSAGASRREVPRNDQPSRWEVLEGGRGIAQVVERLALRARPDRVHRVGATAGRHRAATRRVRE